MTASSSNRSLRFGLAAVLCAVWVWMTVQWSGYPNGAAATQLGLVGFAALGLAAWVTPIDWRVMRLVIRIFGTIIGVLAIALCAWLELLLRNGL